MLIKKRFNSKILKCLSIAFFVITLIVHPSLSSLDLPSIGSSTSIEIGVNTQAAEPENAQQNIGSGE